MSSTSHKHVVIYHGLGGFPKTMFLYEQAAKLLGFSVHNLGYLGRYKTFDGVAEALYKKTRKHVPKGADVHFIGHSMGGNMLRYMVAQQYWDVKSVSTLGTPFFGATWIDDVPGGNWIGRKFFGKAIIDTFSDCERICQLPTLDDIPTLNICGNKSFTWGNPLSWYVGPYIGDSDGFVPIKDTKLPNAVQIIVPEDHLTMICKPYIVTYVMNHITQADKK